MRYDVVDKPPAFANALVDADVLRYRCGFAVEYTQYIVEGLDEPLRGKKTLNSYLELNPNADYTEKKVVEPPQNAIQVAKNYLAQIERRTGGNVQLILSGKNNFRDEVATIKPYKGNRPARKPECFQAMTEWMIKQGAIVTDGIEADDMMGIMADENSVICTVDKDLLQVPGWHYNFVTDEFMKVSEEQGAYNLALQIIAGDSTDNIQGIPGIGMTKAGRAIGAEDDPDAMTIRAYEAYEAYYGADAAPFFNENAELVYILRHQDDKWEWLELEEDDDGETHEEV